MANTQVEIQKIIFDTSDVEVTKVTIEIKHNEMNNILMKCRYEKTYPARIPIVELLTDYVFSKDNYLLW